jgi:hypothetical protein
MEKGNAVPGFLDELPVFIIRYRMMVNQESGQEDGAALETAQEVAFRDEYHPG